MYLNALRLEGRGRRAGGGDARKRKGRRVRGESSAPLTGGRERGCSCPEFVGQRSRQGLRLLECQRRFVTRFVTRDPARGVWDSEDAVSGCFTSPA